MAEQGLSMIEASKFVKANNLYQPQARSPPTRARIDLGATHMKLPPSATAMRKPRALTQLESNLSYTDPREFKTQPKAVANPSSIFKAPKRAKKAKVANVDLGKYSGEIGQIMNRAEDVFATDPRARELFKGIVNLPEAREKLPAGAREVFDALGVKDLKGLREKRQKEGLKSLGKKSASVEEEDHRKDPRIRPKDPRDGVFPQDVVEDKIEEIYEKKERGSYKRKFLNQLTKEQQFKIRQAVGNKMSQYPQLFLGQGGGMDQKEELMAERNGQFVGLAVGRPGVRPKKATGGRALVPIDQLPSAIGGSINRQDYTTMI